MDKITEDLVCQECWVQERNRPRQCREMNCCCLLKDEILEDSPTLGIAVFLATIVLYINEFGQAIWLLGC